MWRPGVSSLDNEAHEVSLHCYPHSLWQSQISAKVVCNTDLCSWIRLLRSSHEHGHDRGEHSKDWWMWCVSRASIGEAVPHFERFFDCLFIHSLFHIVRLVNVDGSSVHEVFKLAAVLRLPLELLVVLEELEKGTRLLVFGEVVKRALRDMVVMKLSSMVIWS